MVAGRRGGRRRHRRRHVPLRAAPAPAPRCWSGPAARPSARCPAAASRARSTSWARRSSASGAPVLQRYGVSDDDAFAVGLTCGGILDVFVETVSQETFPELGEVADDIEAGRPVAVATVIDHPDPAWVGRRLVVRPEDADRMPAGSLGSAARRRRRHRRRPRPARRRPHRDPAPTAPTASAAARACGCSSPPTRPARGCSSSARSTSPRRSRTSAPSSATG